MRRPLPRLPPTWPSAYPRHRPVDVAVAQSLDRRATQEHGIPSLVLMEHAARGVAVLAARICPPEGRIVVLCGPGNNGGDGYGAARHLAAWGRRLRLLRLAPGPPRGGDAATLASLAGACFAIEDAWSRPDVVAEAVERADLVVDAVFGVGRARVEGPFPGWFATVGATDALRLAVDLPSGLDGQTGRVAVAAVPADVTATLGLPKKGLEGTGAAWAGQVVEVDIGLPALLLAPFVREDPSGREAPSAGLPEGRARDSQGSEPGSQGPPPSGR